MGSYDAPRSQGLRARPALRQEGAPFPSRARLVRPGPTSRRGPGEVVPGCLRRVLQCGLALNSTFQIGYLHLCCRSATDTLPVDGSVL